MGRPVKTRLSLTVENPLHNLTPQQRRFIDNMLKGQSQTVAARAAGYSFPASAACKLLGQANIQEGLRYLHKKYEKNADMNRKKVMDGFKEAIDMAKIQGDPATMVSGWREIGRMCGYYAPEKKEIDINITAKRAVDKLETLSDAELLEMIENDEEAIDGEYTEILETTQEQDDAAWERDYGDENVE
jgi:hypothetical protein